MKNKEINDKVWTEDWAEEEDRELQQRDLELRVAGIEGLEQRVKVLEQWWQQHLDWASNRPLVPPVVWVVLYSLVAVGLIVGAIVKYH